MTLGAPMDRSLRTALIYVGRPESAAVPVMTPPVGTQLLAGLVLREGFDARLFDTRLQDEAELSWRSR